MAATAASTAASASTARPRFVWRTVPLRLNNGREPGAVLPLQTVATFNGETLSGRNGARALLQRRARALNRRADRVG